MSNVLYHKVASMIRKLSQGSTDKAATVILRTKVAPLTKQPSQRQCYNCHDTTPPWPTHEITEKDDNGSSTAAPLSSKAQESDEYEVPWHLSKTKSNRINRHNNKNNKKAYLFWVFISVEKFHLQSLQAAYKGNLKKRSNQNDLFSLTTMI